MIVCPVCEHPQQSGAECDVCGKPFARGALPIVPVSPMEGLETTRLEDASPVEGGAVATLPELEPTRSGPVDVPEERTPDLEPTRAQPVDVDGAAVPDIERHHADLPEEPPADLPVAPICRYCRTPAVPGERLCSRCGMRLPVIDAALIPAGAEGIHQCVNCGSVTTRALCPACGNRLTPVDLE